MSTCEVQDNQSVSDMIHRKPSIVIRAAIHGLQAAMSRDDFELDMCVYGDTMRIGDKGICMGCLATCAMQSLFNVKFTTKTILSRNQRATAIGTDFVYLQKLENAVDDVRCGDVYRLFQLCKVDLCEVPGLAYVPYRDGTLANSSLTLLTGEPKKADVDIAVTRLTFLAERLEAKGF